MDENTKLLREIRDLLLVMAEPAIASRDKKLRALLSDVVGSSKQKAKSALLMDGSKPQALICKDSGMNNGNLSRFVASLRANGLIAPGEGQLKLAISIPSNFFDNSENRNE